MKKYVKNREIECKKIICAYSKKKTAFSVTGIFSTLRQICFCLQFLVVQVHRVTMLLLSFDLDISQYVSPP